MSYHGVSKQDLIRELLDSTSEDILPDFLQQNFHRYKVADPPKYPRLFERVNNRDRQLFAQIHRNEPIQLDTQSESAGASIDLTAGDSGKPPKYFLSKSGLQRQPLVEQQQQNQAQSRAQNLQQQGYQGQQYQGQFSTQG